MLKTRPKLLISLCFVLHFRSHSRRPATRKNIALIPCPIFHCTRSSTRLGICLISRRDRAVIKPIAIRQKFGCWETLSTLVAGKMENGYASHRRRWSTIGTTRTAVITYAPHRRRQPTRLILFIASLSVRVLRDHSASVLEIFELSRLCDLRLPLPPAAGVASVRHSARSHRRHRVPNG